MATEIVNTKCCGVGEINNLGQSTDWTKMLVGLEGRLRVGYDHFGRWKLYGAITFTGVTRREIRDHSSGRPDDYGQGFVDFIRENDLGTVVEGAEFMNWTTNVIKLWVWMPNYDNIFAFIAKHKPVEGPALQTADSYTNPFAAGLQVTTE